MKQSLFLIFVALFTLTGGGQALAADPHAGHGAAPATATAIPAAGTVKSVDAAAGQLVIEHDPIPALRWPRMVMNFRLADRTLASKVKAGDQVKFMLAEGQQGAYVITAIEPIP